MKLQLICSKFSLMEDSSSSHALPPVWVLTYLLISVFQKSEIKGVFLKEPTTYWNGAKDFFF